MLARVLFAQFLIAQKWFNSKACDKIPSFLIGIGRVEL
jgi:hypothetical protein